MASINERGGFLFFDFRYQGKRCREYTKLPDTPANRKRMEKALAKIEKAIAEGRFDYATIFPGSRMGEQLANRSVTPSSRGASRAGATPSFRSFIEDWFRQSVTGWRKSHAATVRSSIDTHMLPFFGDIPVGELTKADLLDFRAEVAGSKGRGENETLSAKTVNRIMQTLGQALGEAGEQYGFTNPAERIKRR